eukprot:TRINITY_DN27432_c0_g1_i2.p1 TRINITY_DN27432_c0_g1~~TRINITY_DN27432_c0_g1_i2.p1  ORF type:complete len:313 (+),score=46.98 TRINITY_DN27432_c0_g1_i2:128-1066(+)
MLPVPDQPIAVSFDQSCEVPVSRRRRCLKRGLVAVALVTVLAAGPIALTLRNPWRARGEDRNVEDLEAPSIQQVSAVAQGSSSSTHGNTALAAASAGQKRTRPRPPWAPVLAIFADYDGCWDIISPTNQMARPRRLTRMEEEQVKLLRSSVAYLSRKRERIIIFVGSNRQDHRVDQFNAYRNGNGLALGTGGGFERLVADYAEEGWELNKALLADGDEPFSAWNNQSKIFDWVNGEEAKRELVENNLQQLRELESVDVYFFDDVDYYLNYVRYHADIPRNVNFYTVLFNPYLSPSLRLVAKDKKGKAWRIKT